MMLKEFLLLLKDRVKALCCFVYRRKHYSPKLEKSIDRFHKFYYHSGVASETYWLGIEAHKCPLDLWIYQEIIYKTRPDVIIESGTAYGGSALFLASICDLVNHGEILTIDIEKKKGRPRHKRIRYLAGSSTSKKIVEKVKRLIGGKNKVMVVLDSDHHKEHVLKELRIYSKFVTKGNYLIVEDTNLNGHPVKPDFGPGPMEAVARFLRENKDFVIDRDKEKLYLTFNPKGYLQKIK